ncbi:MAG TPA: hypothetical protein QF555_01425 [Candidatus Thalassarchaeaceae archaeon]|jgi:hypothetical protein|nr:hypothetical protein [Candidatus Thalassarchaeaceae archaeon]
MRGQPRVIQVDGTTILRGLMFSESEEETLLHLAACEKIELNSTTQDWNLILRGLMELSRRAGSQPMNGEELKQLRISLPVNFT